MKILVTLKKVPDPDLKLKVNAAGTGIDPAGVKFIGNYFDEIAVEAAIRILEARKNAADEVVVCSIAPDGDDRLRNAQAMGAHRAIEVKHAGALDSELVARILAKVAEREKPDLIVMGKLATDDESGQAAQMLAGLLDIPQACFASKIETTATGLRVTREIDGGSDEVEVDFPCLVTTDLRLPEPRFAPLPKIIQARKKPYEVIESSALGVDAAVKTRVVAVEAPPARKAGEKVADVATLVDKLRREAKVL